MTAIQRWVLEKRITAILGRKGWNITRDSLVTFLSSSYCLRGNRKPQKFQVLLQKCTEQLKFEISGQESPALLYPIECEVNAMAFIPALLLWTFR